MGLSGSGDFFLIFPISGRMMKKSITSNIVSTLAPRNKPKVPPISPEILLYSKTSYCNLTPPWLEPYLENVRVCDIFGDSDRRKNCKSHILGINNVPGFSEKASLGRFFGLKIISGYLYIKASPFIKDPA